MKDFILSCSSTADLTKEHFMKRDISYICFHFELDGKQYMDDLGESVPFDQFYQAMTDGADTKTSQINADEFCEYFDGFLKEGKDILHLTLSSGISGVINSAKIAQSMMQEKYKNIRIERFMLLILWLHLPDMDYLWINSQICEKKEKQLMKYMRGQRNTRKKCSIGFLRVI